MTDFPEPSPHALFWEPSEILTKRDWFAGMALQGLLAHASGEAPKEAPALAFVLADMMIAEGARDD